MDFLTQGATLGLSGALSPGPLQAYMLSQAAKRGPWRTLPIALVPLVTDPVIISTVLLVLSRVPPFLLRGLRVGGGLFVIWLGVSALRALRRPANAPPAHEPPVGFVRAAFVNLTNPHAWIWWSVAGGASLTSAWKASPADGLAYLAGFYLCLVGGNALVIVLFGEVGRVGPRTARALAALSGALLVAFGAWQIVRGISG